MGFLFTKNIKNGITLLIFKNLHKEKRMTYPIRAVAFDIGRVLIDFEHFVFCQNMVPHCNELAATQIYQRIFGCIKAVNLWNSYELGYLNTKDFVNSLKYALGIKDEKFEAEELLEISTTSFFLNEGILEILDDLIEKKVPIFMISNICELHWSALSRKFPYLIDRFPSQNRILSFKLGIRKPDSALYRIALQTLQMYTPKEKSRGIQDILFIDDLFENVYEFQRLTGQAEQYSCRTHTIEDLKKIIRKYKIWP
ncbi:MAG: hypothetical protein L3J07_00915 [Candidatus Magasanikbacteria bacterium]|nr:hypothetical protein [Candidatus Magasanikbacteria bacterium]